jgi:hypothetical protein
MPYYGGVPEISRFLGIVVAMFYREHEPAHFHAYYGEFEVTVLIESGLVSGRFPPRALGHVQEWSRMHKQELRDSWELARNSKPLKRIPPLE